MASEREVIDLYCGLEKVFGEHSFWVREITVFTVSGVAGKAAVVGRFQKTADDIADSFRNYYSGAICEKIREFYAERALIIIEIVRTYTYENIAFYDKALSALENNRRNIAAYFFEIDPIYSEERLLDYLNRNDEYIIQQLKRRFAGRFDGEILSFDLGYSIMIDMADYLSDGISKTVL
jgi:hypothetical protein